MNLKLQIVMIGKAEVETEDYMEQFCEENDVEDPSKVEIENLIAYTKEQVKDEVESGDFEINSLELVSVTRL